MVNNEEARCDITVSLKSHELGMWIMPVGNVIAYEFSADGVGIEL